jgi:hypothetical protein
VPIETSDENVNTIKKRTEGLSHSSKKFGPGVNGEKS